MKNQLDIIISGVVLFIAIVLAVVFFSTKRTPVKPSDPPQPSLKAVNLPNPQPTMINGLNFSK